MARNPFEETARAGAVGEPANIEFDRAGGFGGTPWGNERDRYTETRDPGIGGLTNQFDPWKNLMRPSRTNLDSLYRLGETTIPEGRMPPDRYGRMRPELNPRVYRPTGPYTDFQAQYEDPMIGGGGDQAYMEPGPWGPWGPWGPEFPKPRPGGEWPRPGELVGETDDLSDMAANSPEYLKFKSLRRKFGSQKAIEMMGMNVNRGGIMGLI